VPGRSCPLALGRAVAASPASSVAELLQLRGRLAEHLESTGRAAAARRRGSHGPTVRGLRPASRGPILAAPRSGPVPRSPAMAVVRDGLAYVLAPLATDTISSAGEASDQGGEDDAGVLIDGYSVKDPCSNVQATVHDVHIQESGGRYSRLAAVLFRF